MRTQTGMLDRMPRVFRTCTPPHSACSCPPQSPVPALPAPAPHLVRVVVDPVVVCAWHAKVGRLPRDPGVLLHQAPAAV
jgi:hypothetical protein